MSMACYFYSFAVASILDLISIEFEVDYVTNAYRLTTHVEKGNNFA